MRAPHLERAEDLPHGAGCVLLAVVAPLDDPLEQLAARDQLEHQLDLRARLEHLAQPDLSAQKSASLVGANWEAKFRGVDMRKFTTPSTSIAL